MEIETFKCEDCGCIFNFRKLTRRDTTPGQYCPNCGANERCSACGEMEQKALVAFKDDVQNYICNNCLDDYKSVESYIKPLNISFFRQQPVMVNSK